MTDENGWGEWKNAVLQDLKELKDGQRVAFEEITKLRETIAGLQVKTSVMSVLAGTVSAALTSIGIHLAKK